MFPQSYKYFWKAYPKWCIFSIQRTFVSDKITHFVQFVRMRLFYSPSTEKHHGSVQSEPFCSERGDGENIHQFYYINVQVAFWRGGNRKGDFCGSAEYVKLTMLKTRGFWRLPVDLPCRYLSYLAQYFVSACLVWGLVLWWSGPIDHFIFFLTTGLLDGATCWNVA